MKIYLHLMVACFGILSSGCFYSALNQSHYSRYYEAGLRALDRGDNESAKKHFARASNYAQVGFLSPESEAAATFNYGIAIGRLGDFEGAEGAIKRSLELDAKSKTTQPDLRILRLCNLARLYQAWGRTMEACENYDEVKSLVTSSGYDKRYPIAFAVTLEDYARALE